MFISTLYLFQAAMCPSSGELIASIRHLVYVTLYRWPFSVQIWMKLQSHPNLHTKLSSIQSDIYQMSYWYNWFSWWWAHGCLKQVKNRNKHTWKRIVCKVGYLQRLYRDAARSTEHKKPSICLLPPLSVPGYLQSPEQSCSCSAAASLASYSHPVHWLLMSHVGSVNFQHCELWTEKQWLTEGQIW